MHSVESMQPIATDVTCSVVCMSCLFALSVAGHTDVLYKNLEMPFWKLTNVGSRSPVLNRVKIGRIHSQPRGVTSWRCGLFQTTLDTCLNSIDNVIHVCYWRFIA